MRETYSLGVPRLLNPPGTEKQNYVRRPASIDLPHLP